MTATEEAAPEVRLRLRLPGPWRPFDPEQPIPADIPARIAEELRRSGLLQPPRYDPQVDVVLGAHMVEYADDGVELPPLVASLAVTRTRSTSPVEVGRMPDGALRPERDVRRTVTDWPDVGPVTFHHVRYVVPTPDGDLLYALDFATPNLPMSELLEVMFDVIVGTAEFVAVPTPASD